MHKVAVLISGGGSNMENIIRYSLDNPGVYSVTAVISDREAQGLKKAENLGVDKEHIHLLSRKDPDFRDRLRETLETESPDFIVLAGFLSVIPPDIIEMYKERIINIHPSLLPDFGGIGMHGRKVHEAVLKDGRKMSGCTCHIVDKDVDRGRILLRKEVPVMWDDTPESLAQRILPFEHETIVEGLLELIKEKGEE